MPQLNESKTDSIVHDFSNRVMSTAAARTKPMMPCASDMKKRLSSCPTIRLTCHATRRTTGESMNGRVRGIDRGTWGLLMAPIVPQLTRPASYSRRSRCRRRRRRQQSAPPPTQDPARGPRPRRRADCPYGPSSQDATRFRRSA